MSIRKPQILLKIFLFVVFIIGFYLLSNYLQTQSNRPNDLFFYSFMEQIRSEQYKKAYIVTDKSIAFDVFKNELQALGRYKMLKHVSHITNSWLNTVFTYTADVYTYSSTYRIKIHINKLSEDKFSVFKIELTEFEDSGIEIL